MAFEQPTNRTMNNNERLYPFVFPCRVQRETNVATIPFASTFMHFIYTPSLGQSCLDLIYLPPLFYPCLSLRFFVFFSFPIIFYHWTGPE